VLRRHVIDAFGLKALARGSGVLDVAGGKGEVAFQFLNLNEIPATVIDPRPLRLKQFERRATVGWWRWRERLVEGFGGCWGWLLSTALRLGGTRQFGK